MSEFSRQTDRLVRLQAERSTTELTTIPIIKMIYYDHPSICIPYSLTGNTLPMDGGLPSGASMKQAIRLAY